MYCGMLCFYLFFFHVFIAGCKVDAQDNDGNTALHVAQISRALPDTVSDTQAHFEIGFVIHLPAID